MKFYNTNVEIKVKNLKLNLKVTFQGILLKFESFK